MLPPWVEPGDGPPHHNLSRIGSGLSKDWVEAVRALPWGITHPSAPPPGPGFLIETPRARQGAGQTLPDRGEPSCLVPAPCIHPPAHRRPSLRHGGIDTIKERAAPPWGLPWPPAPAHNRPAPALAAHGHRPGPPGHPPAIPPPPPCPRPPLPGPKGKPGDWDSSPPVLYAWPGPYAIFSAYTVFVSRGDPAEDTPPGDGTQAQKFQTDFRPGVSRSGQAMPSPGAR